MKKINVSETDNIMHSKLERAAEDAVKVIADSAGKASQTIANAAEAATKLLASSAESATKLLASNASDALKISSQRDDADHDILVVLKSKMEDLKNDIRDLKDNTSKRVDALEHEKLSVSESYASLYKTDVEKHQLDHETRIRDNEKNITKILTYGSIVLVVIGVVQAIIIHFLK